MLLLFVAAAELVVLLFILLLPCGFVYGFWLVQNWRFRSLHYTVRTHIWIFRRIGSIGAESKQRRNREEIGGVWIQLNCSCRCHYSISNFTKCWWIQSRFFSSEKKERKKVVLFSKKHFRWKIRQTRFVRFFLAMIAFCVWFPVFELSLLSITIT